MVWPSEGVRYRGISGLLELDLDDATHVLTESIKEWDSGLDISLLRMRRRLVLI